MSRKKYGLHSSENQFAECETREYTEKLPAEEEANGPETKNGTIINSMFVKIRDEPHFGADVVTVIQKGDKATILSRVGNFNKVIVNGKIGYIASDFIKEE